MKHQKRIFDIEDIIPFLLVSLVLFLLFYCFYAGFTDHCIPGEHFLRMLWHCPSEVLYCSRCGDLLVSVPRCVCGAVCRSEFCSSCGLPQ